MEEKKSLDRLSPISLPESDSREVKVGNTVITVTRSFGSRNLMELYSEYVAKKVCAKISNLQAAAQPN